MSLKAFHIIFVTVSVMLTVFLSVWAFNNYLNNGRAAMDLVYASASALATVALLVYGKYFLRKVKHISYL